MRILVVVLVLGVPATASYYATVTYDHRALVIGGKRRVLVSGSIHYPRSTPEMWPDLIQKSKDRRLGRDQDLLLLELAQTSARPVCQQWFSSLGAFHTRNSIANIQRAIQGRNAAVHSKFF